MPNRKVLIITYYWPPSGGSGVQRWLKFVKYLVQMGWEPIVYTPENPTFEIKDESLLKDIPPETEVLKLPIWEPYAVFQKLSVLFGKKNVAQADFISTGKKSVFQKMSGWVRGNFFIPDARMFWVKPSAAFLSEFIRSAGITRIITTGPPHSMHLIGLRLKKKMPALKWIADFRDPWSEWDLLDTLSLTPLAKSLHRRMEREVLQRADQVITIAPYHATRLKELSGREVELITNGFDEDDFHGIVHQRTSNFTIRHIGVVDELRDPRPFMEALKSATEKDNELLNSVVVEFIGKVNSAFRKFVEDDKVLSKLTKFAGQLPHAELLALYGKTDLQLLVLAYTVIAPGNLPGKFFEYLASGNPILAIGPTQGDAAAVLKETGVGRIFERGDQAGIQQAILDSFSAWKKGTSTRAPDVSAYTRKKLTEKLASILGGLSPL